MKRGQSRQCKRFKYTKDEDEKLKELVSMYGTNNWEHVAKLMPNRNSRQCHDRWIYYLSPDVNTMEWTAEEEENLINFISKHGKKWTQIAKYFKGRNDIQIKNKWNSLKKRLNGNPRKEGKKVAVAIIKKDPVPVKEEPVTAHIQKRDDPMNKFFDFELFHEELFDSYDVFSYFY